MLLGLLTAAGSICVENSLAGVGSTFVSSDSIIISKTNNNKRHSINIYTNASQQVLFFSAAGEEGKNYQLLLFRDKGKLIKQSKIRNRETAVVSKPDKGNYYYEVFIDDLRIESGTIVVQ